MRSTRLIMGMPITIEVATIPATHEAAIESAIETVFAYFTEVDERFSTYKETSEVSRLNRGELAPAEYSPEMREVLALCEQTTRETGGYFDIWRNGVCDPSGLVKGWAVHRAEALLRSHGCHDYFFDAGGDIALCGHKDGRPWRVGIRNPFARDEIVKVLTLTNHGVATSGTAIRGQHIFDPYRPGEPASEIASLTVVGPTIYEADRFATAAFAMGRRGIAFIEMLPDFEGYQIDMDGQAILTSGFERYAHEHS